MTKLHVNTSIWKWMQCYIDHAFITQVIIYHLLLIYKENIGVVNSWNIKIMSFITRNSVLLLHLLLSPTLTLLSILTCRKCHRKAENSSTWFDLKRFQWPVICDYWRIGERTIALACRWRLPGWELIDFINLEKRFMITFHDCKSLQITFVHKTWTRSLDVKLLQRQIN